MLDFQNLQKILDEMDFSQLRALKSSGGRCATDDAIHFFVNNFVDFFSKVTTRPTPEQLKTYKDYMEKITNKINESKYAYYLEKYTSECPDYAKGGFLLSSKIL